MWAILMREVNPKSSPVTTRRSISMCAHAGEPIAVPVNAAPAGKLKVRHGPRVAPSLHASQYAELATR